MPNRFPIFLALLLSSLLCASAARAASYAITDLGILSGGSSSRATALNNLGQVVGYSSVGGFDRAFVYSGGSLADLGTLGGASSRAYGINDAGQIVGQSDDGSYARAFLYQSGSMSALIAPDSTSGSATAINAAGRLVGQMTDASGAERAFLYDGMFHDLGTLGGNRSGSLALNDVDVVVGYARQGASGLFDLQAFRYSNGSMEGLGTLGGNESRATGVNLAGTVVGWSVTADNVVHAFRHSGGAIEDLGTLGGLLSEAYGINAAGHIVGMSRTNNGDAAFLYTDDSGMIDLYSLAGGAASGWDGLLDARAINDLGQIVGSGIIDGEVHAFLMTPLAVPVPGALWLLVSGLAVLGSGLRRRGALRAH